MFKKQSDSFLLERAYENVLTDSNFDKSINYLLDKKHVLLIATSNRWEGSNDVPKSTRIAQLYQDKLSGNSTFIDASKLKIYDCEGNVSDGKLGNHCGVLKAKLKDKSKNPSGEHRCWASINNNDDELWKISKVLLDKTDAIMFFGSIRWGQANAIYQRLIERLTWLQNRHETYNESNLLKNIDAGVVFVNHNWKGKQVLDTQKEVLKFFGFNVPNQLSWNWQYLSNPNDESLQSYKDNTEMFNKQFPELKDTNN